jgi:hypothetical protein
MVTFLAFWPQSQRPVWPPATAVFRKDLVSWNDETAANWVPSLAHSSSSFYTLHRASSTLPCSVAFVLT